MKKPFVLLILLIILIVTVSGCASDTRIPRDELFSYINNIGKAPHAADFEVLQNGQPMQEGTSGYKKYYDGEGHYRFDTEMEGKQIRFYVSQEEPSYSCEYVDNDWVCEEAGISLTMTFAPEQGFSELKNYADRLVVEVLASQNIAGTSAKCFSIQNTDQPESSIELCFSQEGAFLSQKVIMIAEGQEFTTEIKATSYTPDVSSEDFELPS